MPRIPSIVTAAAALVLAVAVGAPPALAQHRPRPERPDRPSPSERHRGARPAPAHVQLRSYEFSETHEMLPYALFVSSKVRPDQKAPLIVALHGLGGDPTALLRGPVLKLAEEGGYIVVGPMGYNDHGWYGSPVFTPPNRVAHDPANLDKLSEKDVLNVMDLVRHEFSVDENRVYLLGHSMGGAGALHLAVKYPKTWAAVAALAPASFNLKPESLAAIPDMPIIVVHGDADSSVPVSMSRAWADYMKEHKMPHTYLEIPGGSHGAVISAGMRDVFEFFGEHARSARH